LLEVRRAHGEDAQIAAHGFEPVLVHEMPELRFRQPLATRRASAAISDFVRRAEGDARRAS